jgi:hypothetical protein
VSIDPHALYSLCLIIRFPSETLMLAGATCATGSRLAAKRVIGMMEL